MDPALQRVQESLILTHIWEVAIKMRKDREAKVQDHKSDDEKGIPNLLGTNLTYLLHLGQISAHEDLLPIRKELVGGPNRQYLTTLQRALKNTSLRLSVRAPISAMPGLIKFTLALRFLLDHRDDLGTGMYQFGLGQHTSTV